MDRPRTPYSYTHASIRFVLEQWELRWPPSHHSSGSSDAPPPAPHAWPFQYIESCEMFGMMYRGGGGRGDIKEERGGGHHQQFDHGRRSSTSSSIHDLARNSDIKQGESTVRRPRPKRFRAAAGKYNHEVDYFSHLSDKGGHST